MQKLLRAEAVQDLLRIIYELQTRYIQAKENIINLEVQRAEYAGEIGKQARMSEKEGIERRSTQKIETALLKTEGAIKGWEVIIDSSVTALKNLMDLDSSEEITFSDDYIAIKAIRKSFDIDDKIRETLEPIGIVESAVGTVELMTQKEAELKQLDNALVRASKKLSVKVTLRALFGADLGIGSFLGLEFRRDKRTDPRVSLLAAINAMNGYEDSVKDAGLRKTMLGRKLDELLKTMDDLKTELQAARVNLDKEKESYLEAKQQVPLSKVDNCLQAYASILSTIAWTRKDFNDTLNELKDLEKGLTAQTVEMDEKFKLDTALEKALEETGQAVTRLPAQKAYISGDIPEDIKYALDHSAAIQSAKNNTMASKRAREAKLAQISDSRANPLKKLLKQRRAIEDEFHKMFKDDPLSAVSYFNERKKEYDEIQDRVEEEVSILLEIIDRDDKRAKLKVEMKGPDAEAIDLANFGGKIKLRLGKTNYGEIRLSNTAVTKAENEEKNAANTITDNSLRNLITLRDISSVIGKKRRQIVLLEKALVEAKTLNRDHPTDANSKRARDIELAHIRVKALLENLHFLSDDALMRYKVILGLDPEARLDISGLLAMNDEDFSEYFKKSVDAGISSSFNIRQPIEAMDNRIDTLKALKDIADEGAVIPVEIAVNTGGYFIPAEILNMRNRTGIKIGKLYAETALAKGENVRKDSRLILYHEMLIAGKNNSVARDKVDLAKRRLDRANMDLAAVTAAKDKTELDRLYAEMDVIRLEEESLAAEREWAHTYINAREKDPKTLSAEFGPEASSPKEKIALDADSITSDDTNAALDLDTIREVADITKKTFLWNSSSVTPFLTGSFPGSRTSSGSTPIYDPIGYPERSPVETETKTSREFSMSAGLRIDYYINELFKKSAKITKENAALHEELKKVSDFMSALRARDAAYTLAERHDTTLLWNEILRRTNQDLKLTQPPYSSAAEEKNLMKISSIADEFSTLVKMAGQEEEVANLGINSILKEANADVTVIGILDEDAPKLAPELRDRFLASSGQNALIEARKREEAMAELGLSEAKIDRLLPKMRLEAVFSLLGENVGVEAIFDGGRLRAQENIARMHEQNIEKLRRDTIREVKSGTEVLLKDLRAALESLENSEKQLVISRNEYLAKKALFEKGSVSQEDFASASKDYAGSQQECLKAFYHYRKMYSMTRSFLWYYGIKEEDITSIETSYINSLTAVKTAAPIQEDENVRLELQRAELEKLQVEMSVAEERLADERSRVADKKAPGDRDSSALKEAQRAPVILREAEGRPKDLKNQILRRAKALLRMTKFLKRWTITGDLEQRRIEVELKEKMIRDFEDTGKMIKDVPWEPADDHIRTLPEVSETYRQAVTALLNGLGISPKDDRALNFNDWVSLFETYRYAHNISEDEMSLKLQLMTKLYKDKKSQIDALAKRPFKVILWEKHYEGYLALRQSIHLNDYKDDDGTMYDDAAPISFVKIGLLSYIASRAMAENKEMNPLFDDVMKYEGEGGIVEREYRSRNDKEYKGAKPTKEELERYFNWLIATAIDVDNQELHNLPSDGNERINSDHEIHNIIKEVFDDKLAIFGDNTDRGNLEVWNIYRLITKDAKAGDRRDNYEGLKNNLVLLKRIVDKDEAESGRLFGNYTRERLSKLPHAAKLRSLIEERAWLSVKLGALGILTAPAQNEKYQNLSEKLSRVDGEIGKEIRRLKDGELYGVGTYFVRYGLELPENKDLLEALAERPLTEEEIERIISPIRDRFSYMVEIIPYIEKVYDFRNPDGSARPFDPDNKEDMGTLGSFYDLAKAQDDIGTPEDESWTMDESKAILQRIARVKETARRMFAQLRNVGVKDIVFGPERENTNSIGFLFAFGTDVFANSYSWKEFFNEDGSVKDADKLEKLLSNLPKAKDEAENLLRAIVNKNVTLSLKDPRDSGFLINWVRQRVADGWEHTAGISDTYIFIFQSPEFAGYLKELGVSDNFRQELTESFLGIKNAENRDRYYDLMGRVSYFANGWRTKEDAKKELDYRLDRIRQFKDYFAKRNVGGQSVIAAFSDSFKKFTFTPIETAGKEIDNYYEVSKFFYMLKREIEAKGQGKKWSGKLIEKEEKKFETTFFESNILSFARFIDTYGMPLDTFMEDFEAIFKELRDYPIDLEVGNKPVISLQMEALKRELERNNIKIDDNGLRQIFLENQRQSLAMFWLRHMRTEIEPHTLTRVKEEIKNRKIIWKAALDKKDRIGTMIDASQIGFLADLYGKKSSEIDKIFFDRAIFIQDLARENLHRELLFEGLMPWVGLHRLNIDMPLRSQFGRYETLPEQRMRRTFSDVIRLDPDKAYLRTLDDERFRLVVWKGSRQLRKDLIGDKEANSFWMSLPNQSAEDRERLSNLLNCGSVAVSDFRNIIFNIKLLTDPGKIIGDKENMQRLIVRRLLTRHPARELTESEEKMDKGEFIKYLIEKLKIRRGVISAALEYVGVNYDITIKEMLGKDVEARLSALDKKEEIKAVVTDTVSVYSALRAALGRDPDIKVMFDTVYNNRVNGDIDKILHIENEMLKRLILDLADSNAQLPDKEEMQMSDQDVVDYWLKKYSLEDYMLSGRYDLRGRFIHALEARLVERKELKTLLTDLGVIAKAVKDADEGYSKATWAMNLKDPDTMNLAIVLLNNVKALGLESTGIINIEKDVVLTAKEDKKIKDFNGAIEYECRAEAEHEIGILVRMRDEHKTRIEIVSDLEQDKVTSQLKVRKNWFNWILGGAAIGIVVMAIYAHLMALRQRKSARTPVVQPVGAGGALPEGRQVAPGPVAQGGVFGPPGQPRQDASPNALSGFPKSMIFYLSVVLLQALGIGLIYMKTFDWANVSPAFSVVMILAYIWLNIGNAIVMTDRIATKVKNRIRPLNKEDYQNGVPRHKRTAVMITALARGDSFTLTLENEIAKTLLKNRDDNIIAIIYDTGSLDDAGQADQLRRVDLIRAKYGLTNAQLLYFHRGSPSSLDMDEQGNIINLDKKFGSLTDMMRFLGDGITRPATEYEAYTGRTLKRAVFIVSGLSGMLAAILTVPYMGLMFGILVGISASSFIGFIGALITSGATSRRARVRGVVRDLQDARVQEPLFDRVDGDLTALGFAANDFTDLCEMRQEDRFSPNRDDKLWGLFLLDDKNFAGDTIAEAVRTMVKTLLVHSKRARIETNLEQRAEEIMARMETRGIINLTTEVNDFAAADNYNWAHLDEIRDHLINEEHFNRQDVGDLRDFLENVCYHYQPIRKAIEVLAHTDQDFAAFGNVWIDGPNIDMRGQTTQSIWEYWMWNASKSGQFFENSMQMFIKRASIYGKGLVVIDRYLNPKKIRQEKRWGLFLVGVITGAVLGGAGACFAGWGGVGAFTGLFIGAALGAFEGRFHRGAFGAGYTGELSHDYFEADNTASIHTRIAGIYEPGAKNYIEQKERALFRWFMGVLVYFRHNFGPGITMADRWINYLAQRMYLNEAIFFIWTMGTLLLGPLVSGSVDRLLFGPRLLEFANPLVMGLLLVFMWFQIILLPNMIFKDKGSLISRRQMVQKVIVTTAIFMNNVTEGTKYLIKNIPRVLIYGTHPRFTAKEISLWKRALIALPALIGGGIIISSYIYPVLGIAHLTALVIGAALFAASYIISRAMKLYVPIFWIAAGLMAGALFIGIPVLISGDISMAGIGSALQNLISNILHPVLPRLSPELAGQAAKVASDYFTTLLNNLPGFKYLFYLTHLIFTLLTSNPQATVIIIKAISVFMIIKAIAGTLLIMKEPMPWKTTLAQRGGSTMPLLYRAAKSINFSFIIALMTVTVSLFTTSNLWPLVFASPLIYSWSLGYMHIWYTAKPMWYEGHETGKTEGQYMVRTGFIGFLRSLPKAIAGDFIATWKFGVKGEGLTRLMRVKHFVSLFVNGAFVIGTLSGIVLMFMVLGYSVVYLIGALPMPAVSTFWSAFFLILQYAFGSFTASLILPQLLSYIIAFPFIIAEWIIDQFIWIQKALSPDKKAGTLRAEFNEISKLFTRQSPRAPIEEVPHEVMTMLIAKPVKKISPVDFIG
ncbi:MAG: TolC family protein, partial [Candidatus Omnitrophota bacterium]|nr:TolC family protein [Candidatus Omnitrophota bacterium]